MCAQIMLKSMINLKAEAIEQSDQLTWKFDSIAKPTLSSTRTDLNSYTVLPIWLQSSDVGCPLFKEVFHHMNCLTVHETVARTVRGG